MASIDNLLSLARDVQLVVEFPYGKQDELAITACAKAIQRLKKKNLPTKLEWVRGVGISHLQGPQGPNRGLPPGPLTKVVPELASAILTCFPKGDKPKDILASWAKVERGF